MALIERELQKKSVADIFDRICGKGVVVDAGTRLSLMDARLQAPGTRIVVVLLDTHKEAA